MLTGAIVLGSFLFIHDVTADDPDPSPDASVSPAQKPPVKKRKYRRSRLTSDLTDGQADKRRILLATGEDRTVDLDFEPRSAGPDGIAIGNPTLVATTLVRIGESRQIVFKPLKAGETTVTVRDTDGALRLIFQVRVTGTSLLRMASDIRSLLRDVEGLDIRIVGPKIVIEGEVLVPADYGRLVTVLLDSTYKGNVINLATLSPYALQLLAKKIQEDIHGIGLANVKTRVVNGFIFLEGSVDYDYQAKRAMDIAFFYLPDLKPVNPMENDPSGVQRIAPRSPIKNFILVNPPPPKKQEKLVRVTVHFVELSKDYNRAFGFKWEPGFSENQQISVGATQAGGVASSQFSFGGTISSLLPKLNSLQQAGYARILKTGTLVVRSGQPAKLNETTEIPFIIQGANNQASTGSKQVGLVMAVTPLILGQSDDIQMDVNMNQTNLVSLGKNGSAPITSNHNVETKLYVKSKDSAAVAGVTSSDIGTDFNKDDPASGSLQAPDGANTNVQPLFSLLRSKKYHKKKSQFVIFITPEIIENASEGTEDLKKNFRVKVR
jgi:pilus assembly protein CpaC